MSQALDFGVVLIGGTPEPQKKCKSQKLYQGRILDFKNLADLIR